MTPLRKLTLSLVIIGSLFVSCGRPSAQRDPATVISGVERAFGIAFPTNANNIKAASWGYRAFLDGNSKNVECVARLELNQTNFLLWRNSVTNSMKEYEQFAPIIDPSLTNKIEWWDLSRYPKDRFTHYFREVNPSPDDYRKLEIYSLNLNGTNTLYIYAFLSKR